MKIEPVGYVRKKAIDFLNGASKTAYVEAKLCRTKTDDFELTYPLYTEAQLRQLGEACAALLENQKYMVLNTFKTYTPDELCRAQRENDKHTARMIRNLIKEMLP